jgi:hypothetical protein
MRNTVLFIWRRSSLQPGTFDLDAISIPSGSKRIFIKLLSWSGLDFDFNSFGFDRNGPMVFRSPGSLCYNVFAIPSHWISKPMTLSRHIIHGHQVALASFNFPIRTSKIGSWIDWQRFRAEAPIQCWLCRNILCGARRPRSVNVRWLIRTTSGHFPRNSGLFSTYHLNIYIFNVLI